jgi:hypothetical protein
MDVTTLQSWLGWSALLNMAVLLIWWLMILLAADWIYRFHSRWFTMSRETFDAMHYGGMGLYKIAIYLLFVIPWLALVVIG